MGCESAPILTQLRNGCQRGFGCHFDGGSGELGLIDISINPNSLVVIGRTHSLDSENRRSLTTIENQNPKLKIMTYDDIYDNAKAVIENLFGPIWENPGNTQIYYLNNP